MKNKIIIIGVLLSILVTISIASASMVEKKDGNFDVSVSLKKGWNIIAATEINEGILPDSEIKLSDIKVVWYYSPITNKYYQIYPNNDLRSLSMEEGKKLNEDTIITSSVWIYSKKAGVLKYNTLEDYLPLDERQLSQGYNFVTITPDMTADIKNLPTVEEKQKYTLNRVKGNCNILKTFFFDSEEQKWFNFSLTSKLDNTYIGFGILVKVSNNCNLGIAEEQISAPPQIPN